MKKVFAFAAAASLLAVAQSGYSLGAGDIAFLSYNADGDDVFAFIATTDIPGSEVIKFTDNGWFAAGSFRANEGIKTWTAPAGGVTAETIVTVNATANTASVGTVTSAGSFTISTSGDQLFAYQGADGSPTFLTGINNDGTTGWQADATSANSSALPASLTDGVNALALSEIDNAAYTGSTSFANVAAALAAIHNPANWTGDDTNNVNAPASMTLPVELDSFVID